MLIKILQRKSIHNKGQGISHFNFLFLCHLLILPAAGEDAPYLFKSPIAKDQIVHVNVVYFHNDC